MEGSLNSTVFKELLSSEYINKLSSRCSKPEWDGLIRIPEANIRRDKYMMYNVTKILKLIFQMIFGHVHCKLRLLH